MAPISFAWPGIFKGDSFKRLLETDLISMLTPRRQLVGLDIGSSAIKLVQLKHSKGRYSLQKFGVKPLDPEVIVDGAVMDEERVVSSLRELVEETGVKNKQVAISISGHAVIVKKIVLPPMSEEELPDQVKLAAEQYIPFDINEVNLDFHVVPPASPEETQAEMTIILVAAKKDRINELTELVKAAGLVPMVMDVDAFAIENMHTVSYPMGQDEVTALVNIGASVMNVNIVCRGASLFTRDIPLGGNRYTEAIQREMGVSYEEAEEIKKSGGENESWIAPLGHVMDEINAEVAAELARTVDYFRASVTGIELDRVLLCGGVAKTKGLVQHLQDRLQVPVEIADPFGEIDLTRCEIDPSVLAEYGPSAAVGVGLALRTTGD